MMTCHCAQFRARFLFIVYLLRLLTRRISQTSRNISWSTRNTNDPFSHKSVNICRSSEFAKFFGLNKIALVNRKNWKLKKIRWHVIIWIDCFTFKIQSFFFHSLVKRNAQLDSILHLFRSNEWMLSPIS